VTDRSLRTRLLDKSFLKGGAMIAVAIAVMNVSTYGFTVIAAHRLGKEPYGAFSALMGALLVVSVLSLGLQATGARRISAAPDQVASIERVVLEVGRRSALGLGLICLLMAPVLNSVLRLNSLPTALLVGFGAIPLTFMGAQAGVLQGERRWAPLGLLYLASGVPRLVIGTTLILANPSEFTAILGVTLGMWAPVIVGWLALRRPRPEIDLGEAHPHLDLLREVATSSQALLAFFALSNADILVARASMSEAEAGLYAGGLIMVKAVLFFPQFVVVIAFPSMSRDGASRVTLAAALGVSASIGAGGVLVTFLLPDLALLFIGGDDFADISGDLWKFAAVGTLLAMLQILVYSALARRQGRAVVAIWTSLAVLIGVALTLTSADALVVLVVSIDALLFLMLFGLALTGTPTRAAQAASVSGSVPAGTGSD
jgi:O-antigen/teichoic acid export membrane protein